MSSTFLLQPEVPAHCTGVSVLSIILLCDNWSLVIQNAYEGGIVLLGKVIYITLHWILQQWTLLTINLTYLVITMRLSRPCVAFARGQYVASQDCTD